MTRCSRSGILVFDIVQLSQQLDLRYGAKRSLADPPRLTLALKSCDISSTRPHFLLVGGNDAFARLYDRRMLPPLTSCQKRMLPPTCVTQCISPTVLVLKLFVSSYS
uniref:Uncharacterized protein n=1 Tax=Gossypium raimondii TaxID=29730 RepID=A0A0D2Q699_GOSRA|nr:hypothetical protein B456_002G010500 [Gossypium raimondii]